MVRNLLFIAATMAWAGYATAERDHGRPPGPPAAGRARAVEGDLWTVSAKVPPIPEAQKTQLETWVTRLGSEKWEERKQAHDDLKKFYGAVFEHQASPTAPDPEALGKLIAVETFLKKARSEGDPEQKRRLDQILKPYEKAFRFTPGTKIHLNGDGKIYPEFPATRPIGPP